jgi:Metal-dependent hydrolases of the beta-lactamase superfamily I
LQAGVRATATYIEGTEGALLIDAGLSAKETFARMAQAGCTPDAIEAIVVTHEHGDHVRGLDVLARKLSCPGLCNAGNAFRFPLPPPHIG